MSCKCSAKQGICLLGASAPPGAAVHRFLSDKRCVSVPSVSTHFQLVSELLSRRATWRRIKWRVIRRITSSGRVLIARGIRSRCELHWHITLMHVFGPKISPFLLRTYVRSPPLTIASILRKDSRQRCAGSSTTQHDLIPALHRNITPHSTGLPRSAAAFRCCCHQPPASPPSQCPAQRSIKHRP